MSEWSLRSTPQRSETVWTCQVSSDIKFGLGRLIRHHIESIFARPAWNATTVSKDLQERVVREKTIWKWTYHFVSGSPRNFVKKMMNVVRHSRRLKTV